MMKKITYSFVMIMVMLTVFSISPNLSFAHAKNTDYLNQKEIEALLGDVVPADARVTTMDELNAIEDYYEKNPNAHEENIEDILKKLNLEDIELVPAEEIEGTNSATSIQTFNLLPNLGEVIFRNVSNSDSLLYASLYITNIGVDSIDQVGGKLYGYAILPHNNLYTLVLEQFFNETYIKPIIGRKVGDFNIPHFKNKAALMASYVARDGSSVSPTRTSSVTYTWNN